MKRPVHHIILGLLIAIILIAPFGGHVAHAGLINIDINAYLIQGLAYIAYFALTFMSWLVGIAGLLLNYAVTFGILNMKIEVDAITTIGTAWKLIRDIGNMAFIFILLYVAIATILELEGIDTKRTIRNLIIVGLLVNFSLFFTKILIDASNILTISFYNLIVHNNGSIRGFAETFSRPLGISAFSDGSKFVQQFASSPNPYQTIAIVGIAGSTFLFCVALSLLFAGFLIIIRFIVLVFLMMLSPLAFFLSILPGTKQYAKKWWNTLINQLTFAPIYMVLIYIVMLLNNTFSIITGGSTVTPNGSNSNLLGALTVNAQDLIKAGPGGSPLDAILRFIVMLAFLNLAAIVATSAAKNSGGLVGSAVSKGRSTFVDLTKRTARFGGGAVKTGAQATGGAAAGLYGAFGRNTFGRAAASKLQTEGEGLRKLAAAGDAKARKQLEKLETQASRSYDFRNTKLGGKLGMGEASGKGGFKAKLEEKQAKIDAKIERKGKVDRATRTQFMNAQDRVNKAEEAYRQAAATGANDATLKSFSDRVKSAKEDAARFQRIASRQVREQRRTYAAKVGGKGWTPATRMANQQASKEFLEKARTAKKSNEEKVLDFEDKIKDSLADGTSVETVIAQDMTPKQVRDLSPDVLTRPEVARYITPEAAEALRRDGDLKPGDKAKIAQILRGRFVSDPKMYQYFQNNTAADNYWK